MRYRLPFSNIFAGCKLHRLGITLLALLALPLMAYGQSAEATVVGTVTDPSAAVMPNVKITITNVQTGATRTLATNDDGQYVVPNVVIGQYNIKAEASGFKAQETQAVSLNVNDRKRVDFQMTVGAAVETVSVEANAVAVQTDSSEQSSLVTGTQIEELATNGRTIYSYVALTPGASSLNPDSQLPVPTGGASRTLASTGTVPAITCIFWTAERIQTAVAPAAPACCHRLTPSRKPKPSLPITARNMDSLPVAPLARRSSPAPRICMLPRGSFSATMPWMRAITLTPPRSQLANCATTFSDLISAAQ